jgi:sigma-B regulation protein RsbU (phosphoserine phosphatase)
LNLGQLISLVYLVSGVTLVMLAGMILRENPKNRLNRITAMMFSLAGIAPLATAFYRSILQGVTGIPLWFENSFVVWELFFPSLLYFTAIFPEPQEFYNKHKRLLQLAFLPHILHLLMVVFLADPDRALEFLSFESSIPILGAILGLILNILKIAAAFLGFLLLFHTRFFSIINIIYVIFSIFLLYTAFKKIENPRLKQQVKVIIYGIGIGVGLYVIGFMIPTIFSFVLSDPVRNAMVTLGLIVGPGSIAWAIVRYQFLDLGLIARRSLVYTITTAIVVGGYLLVVMQVGSVAQSLLGRDSEILNILIIIVLLFFFQPIYTQVDDFVRRIFIRSRGDYSKLVETLSREILTIFHSDRLAETVADMLKREMFIENVEVCFADDRQHFRLSVGGVREDPIKLEDSIYSYLLKKRAPVFVEEISGNIDTNCLGGRFSAIGTKVVVPLVRQEQVSGILLLSGKVAGFRYSSEDMTFLAILANQIVVAMENAELYRESLEKQRLEEELAVARQIQTGLLPRSLPALASYEFAAFIEPSRQVGGDYYDFIPAGDGRIGVVIADASGKGVPAALLIARMQAMMQSEVRFGRGVDEMMASVNNFISESTSQDRFATCFYIELGDGSRKARYCNAGHNYPILIRGDGRVEYLSTGGLLLGAFTEAKYETGVVDIKPGDMLVMYTDGVTEAMDADQNEYGEQRLADDLIKMRSFPAEVVCSKIIKNVKQFAAGIGYNDDMTLVVVKAQENR